MDPGLLGSELPREAFARARDFGDIVVLSALGIALAWGVLLWKRNGELTKQLLDAHVGRVEDAKKSTEMVVTSLGAAKETIGAQVATTERLREAIDRLREASDGLKGGFERVWHMLDVRRENPTGRLGSREQR